MHYNIKGLKTMSASLPMNEGYIPFHGYQTWYRIAGDLTSDMIPLLTLHGGPGIPHDSLEPLETFAQNGRPIIFYDQLGCGKSSRPGDTSLWSVRLFIEEINTIRQALHLDQIHLFGHSWGGVLAMEYALTQPTGLFSITIAGAPASRADFMEGQERVYEQLPVEIRTILARGWSDDPEFQSAYDYYTAQFICRIMPQPDFFKRARENMNTELNIHMWTGELENFDIRPRLSGIQIPTLIAAGRHDGMAVKQEELLHAGIPNSQLIIFENGSHYSFAEEPEQFQATLSTFLTEVETHSRNANL
jgi:proline-specific peptidase